MHPSKFSNLLPPSFLSSDPADLQPANKHLLTGDVHTRVCHSQQEKRPHIKGLSLVLRTSF